ncbi:MAG: hypothetical protein L3K01_01945 [Thermoplasmata archaeon]|nr:hypothetical protein [Thermoplasmata archaeon]
MASSTDRTLLQNRTPRGAPPTGSRHRAQRAALAVALGFVAILLASSFGEASIAARPPPWPHASPIANSPSAAWVDLNLSGPTNRSEFGFVWANPSTGTPFGVLFGGRRGHSSLNDTWLFTNSSWTQIFPSAHPGPTRNGMMAWDPVDQEVVLFGGSNATAYLNATWVFHMGHGWRQLTPTVSPPARRSGGMAYDGADHYVVMWGGHNGTAPNGSINYQPDYTMLNDTWSFSGGAWTQVVTANAPPPSSEPSLQYDPTTGVVIEFGGYDQHGVGGYLAFNQTWAYSAGLWTNLGLVHSPYARDGAASTFDASRGVVLTAGQDEGVHGRCLMNDTWVLSGPSASALHWHKVFTTAQFPPMDSASAVYDSALHANLLFGGTGTNARLCGSVKTQTWLGATWELAP